MEIPAVTAAQMREVDRLMVDEYHIKLVQMMENAGRHLAALARQRFLGGDPIEKRVIVLAGSGGNGGGGLVAARWLHHWGARVSVWMTRTNLDEDSVPAHQLDILQRTGVPVAPGERVPSLPAADVILDAVIGYSLRGAPTGVAAHLIRLANECPAPILSLDVPSGMDATTGEAFAPCIHATATLTLALPKTGLLTENGRSLAGELFLADISVPPQLYAALGLTVGPIFARSDLIHLDLGAVLPRGC